MNISLRYFVSEFDIQIKTSLYVNTTPFHSAKGNCDHCDKFETELFKIRDELKENIPAEVAKVTNSQLVRLYSPKKEPAVVFFRNGVPLLYDGAINAEEIYQQFDANKQPAVKDLTDDTFEHLTQAATGATTGDWLILL